MFAVGWIFSWNCFEGRGGSLLCVYEEQFASEESAFSKEGSPELAAASFTDGNYTATARQGSSSSDCVEAAASFATPSVSLITLGLGQPSFVINLDKACSLASSD